MAEKTDGVRTASAVDGDEGGMAPAPSISFRVATLLELVAFRAGDIGPREAARETGIDRSAVSRIFRQLESIGWVEAVGDRGSYSVGPRMYSVAAAVRQRAKERGLAVGVASALPISIERPAAWTKTLEGRGILLVPLTTAMLKSKSG